MLIAFDSHTGAIVRMESKATGWIFERRPELGVSFRMHVPLPDRRFNFLMGQKQRVKSAQQISANEIRLQWDNLKSENGAPEEIYLAIQQTVSGAISITEECYPAYGA